MARTVVVESGLTRRRVSEPVQMGQLGGHVGWRRGEMLSRE